MVFWAATGGALSGPRWVIVTVMSAAAPLKNLSRPAVVLSVRSVRGPLCPRAPGSHVQALIPRDTAPGPPCGKTDYVPFGLHPVPRGGNWVHPKNNPTCKQL